MGPFPVGVTYLLIYLLNNYIKKFVWDNNIFIHPSFLKVIFEKVAYFVACFTKWHCISGAFFIDIIYWLQSTSLQLALLSDYHFITVTMQPLMWLESRHRIFTVSDLRLMVTSPCIHSWGHQEFLGDLASLRMDLQNLEAETRQKYF